RPHIYFDIHMRDARALGRIVVELCTEAAPLVVLHLMRCCLCDMHKKFLIRRLFPNLWLDVTLQDNGSVELHQPLEYDAKIVDHGASSYVLSFSKDHLQGFRHHMSFSISFRPLSVVNGSRVGFGHVVKGRRILDCLQSYGTKNGKLNRSIIFTSCGVL
ncbi:GH22509, partial [Drosophila grimshawi]